MKVLLSSCGIWVLMSYVGVSWGGSWIALVPSYVISRQLQLCSCFQYVKYWQFWWEKMTGDWTGSIFSIFHCFVESLYYFGTPHILSPIRNSQRRLAWPIIPSSKNVTQLTNLSFTCASLTFLQNESTASIYSCWMTNLLILLLLCRIWLQAHRLVTLRQMTVTLRMTLGGS